MDTRLARTTKLKTWYGFQFSTVRVAGIPWKTIPSKWFIGTMTSTTDYNYHRIAPDLLVRDIIRTHRR